MKLFLLSLVFSSYAATANTDPVCCDVDGSCDDGDDDYCCGEDFYCSNDGEAYAAAMGGILCPADTTGACMSAYSYAYSHSYMYAFDDEGSYIQLSCGVDLSIESVTLCYNCGDCEDADSCNGCYSGSDVGLDQYFETCVETDDDESSYGMYTCNGTNAGSLAVLLYSDSACTTLIAENYLTCESFSDDDEEEDDEDGCFYEQIICAGDLSLDSLRVCENCQSCDDVTECESCMSGSERDDLAMYYGTCSYSDEAGAFFMYSCNGTTPLLPVNMIYEDSLCTKLLYEDYYSCEDSSSCGEDDDEEDENDDSGEAVCEGHSYTESECDAIGCCHYGDDDECWSSVGSDSCYGNRRSKRRSMRAKLDQPKEVKSHYSGFEKQIRKSGKSLLRPEQAAFNLLQRSISVTLKNQ